MLNIGESGYLICAKCGGVEHFSRPGSVVSCALHRAWSRFDGNVESGGSGWNNNRVQLSRSGVRMERCNRFDLW